jgi:hypothetical protein
MYQQEDDTILTIPASSLYNIFSVSPRITDPIQKWYNTRNSPIVEYMSVNGILALSLMQSPPSPWKAMLPPKHILLPSLPHQWPTSLSALLPRSAQTILIKQQGKIATDFTLAIEIFGRDNIDHEEFIYHWFLVSTRTFYWTAPTPPPKAKGRKSPAAKRAALKQKKEQQEKERKIDHDDCISLAPFADMFNHTPNGSVSVTYTKDGYTLSALQDIKAGDELSISYGNHSNDFLLVEYGFLIPEQENCWDEVRLDDLLEGLFDDEKGELIKGKGYWGKWVLDGEGICYRTRVACSLLCKGVTSGRWERMVDNGEDGRESIKKGVDEIVGKALQEYQAVIEERLSNIADVKEGTEDQKAMLRERWKQIGVFVSRYLETSKNT